MLGRTLRDLGIIETKQDERVFTVQLVMTVLAYGAYLVAMNSHADGSSLLAPMPIVFLFGAFTYGFGSKRE